MTVQGGRQRDADVIIIGAGGAGIAAAIESASLGARTLVLEQAGVPGGSAALSSGGCLMVDTPLQRTNGLHDSADIAFSDWVTWGQGAADEAWARYYLDHSLHDLYHWTASMGVQWVGLKGMPGNSIARWHQPQGGGASLTGTMLAHAAATPEVRFRTSTTIEHLLFEGGRACGVVASEGADNELRLYATSVVMATGGFASNHAMLLDHRPEFKMSRLLMGSGTGSAGSGHRMIREAGGTLTHMDAIWFYVYATPDFRDPSGQRGLVFRATPSYIWVNQSGKRFHDESRADASAATPALLAQDPPHAWAVLDARMVTEMEVEDLTADRDQESPRALARRLLHSSPFVHRADSLARLGGAIGVDVPVFLDQIQSYHTAIDTGLATEPAFGRPLAMARRFEQPPFYAIQLFPLARKTLGGVLTDLRCAVLDQRGDAIGGLYAAGEVSGMAGGHINGRAGLEGTMLGPSIFSGRVAGAWAAHAAGFGPGFVGRSSRVEDDPR